MEGEQTLCYAGSMITLVACVAVSAVSGAVKLRARQLRVAEEGMARQAVAQLVGSNCNVLIWDNAGTVG